MSWRYVEVPFKKKEFVSNVVFYPLVAATLSLFILFGLVLHKSYGLEDIEPFRKYSYGPNPQVFADAPYRFEKDHFETSDKRKMLVVGNSFARDFFNALAENQVGSFAEMVYLSSYNEDIEKSRELLGDADIVFWVSSAGMAHRSVDAEALKYLSLGIKDELDTYSNGNYFFVGTKNFGVNNNFVRLKKWEDISDYSVAISQSAYEANVIQGAVFGGQYVDLIEMVSVGKQIRLFTDTQKFISFDTDHFTADGASFMGKKILEIPLLNDQLNYSGSKSE